MSEMTPIRGDIMRVVICGGGVIGACIAYFLARREIDVIVIERTEVAAAASGKAGGFLALDWCAGTPLDELARRSFQLHAALPDEIAGDWGYQRMTAYSGFVVGDRDARRHTPTKLAWLASGIIIADRLGTPATTAIVHPRKFTSAIMSAAQKHGAELRAGQVTGIVWSADRSTVRGVEVGGALLEADTVVIAMGPWSLMAAAWLDLPAVFGQRSPSLVYDTGTDVPADALFLEYQEESGAIVSVEVFPRGDGSTHITAFSNEAPLPLEPAAVTPDPSEIDRLQAICGLVEEALAPLAGQIVEVPAEWLDQEHALRRSSAERVDFRDRADQGNDCLAGRDVEILGRLDGVEQVRTCVGKADDLGLRALRLQKDERSVVLIG